LGPRAFPRLIAAIERLHPERRELLAGIDSPSAAEAPLAPVLFVDREVHALLGLLEEPAADEPVLRVAIDLTRDRGCTLETTIEKRGGSTARCATA
jgi:hypothetical protein